MRGQRERENLVTLKKRCGRGSFLNRRFGVQKSAGVARAYLGRGHAVLVEGLPLDPYAPRADEFDLNVPAAVRPRRDAAQDHLGTEREDLPAARREAQHGEFVAHLGHLAELRARVHATRHVLGVETERQALVGERRVEDDDRKVSGVTHELLLLKVEHAALQTRVVNPSRAFLLIFPGGARGGARAVSGLRGAHAEWGGTGGSRDEPERRYGHLGRAGARSK